jgi:hypothetical protein
MTIGKELVYRMETDRNILNGRVFLEGFGAALARLRQEHGALPFLDPPVPVAPPMMKKPSA